MIRDYLLGRLTDAQTADVERRVLVDRNFFQLLEVIEDELTEKFVDRELPEEIEQDFERHFLAAPQHRQELRFAQAFQQHAAGIATSGQADRPVGKTQGRRLLRGKGVLALAASVFLLLAVFQYWRIGDLNNRLEQSAYTVALASETVRNRGSLTRLDVPPAALIVRFRLHSRQEPLAPLQMVLFDDQNRRLLVQGGVGAERNPEGSTLRVDLPSALLLPGDYSLEIRTGEGGTPGDLVERYSFRVR